MLVAQMWIGPRPAKHDNDFATSARDGDCPPERRVAIGVRGIDVGAGFEEQAGDAGGMGLGREMQSGPAVIICQRCIGAGSKQGPHPGFIAVTGGVVKWRAAIFINAGSRDPLGLLSRHPPPETGNCQRSPANGSWPKANG